MLKEIKENPRNTALFGPGAAVWQEQERLLSDMTGKSMKPSTAPEYNPDGYDVSKGSGSDGPAVNLQWQLVAADEGYYFLQNRACNQRLDGDPGQVVDVSPGQVNDKQWKLIPVDDNARKGLAEKSPTATLEATRQLVIYPNPTSQGTVQLQLSGFDTQGEVQITDLRGNVLYRGQYSSPLISLAWHFPSGVYIVRVTDAQGTQARKLLVK